ncbi:MAG: hypothetical protein KDA61_16100 [Planctomycetales bacterium]|nr:hypothetical protein [Planctomycetales bacterium]
MKFVVRIVATIALLAGGLVLGRLLFDNYGLNKQIAQLEAELGRMPIGDTGRVHLVEIEAPDVPPEVAQHLERIWQFRCYLPPGYDVLCCSGGGRVAKQGVMLDGGTSTGWNSPRSEATHRLFTVSFQKKGERLEAFSRFGASSGTHGWNRLEPANLDAPVVVETIVNSVQGTRSFDQNMILPVLKIYDPRSAEEKSLAGKATATYAGGLFVLCPKSRGSAFVRLLRGETPQGYQASWVASPAGDE